MDPMSMMSGAPSFQGGDGGQSGPAWSEASGTATMASPFNVNGSGSDTAKALQWGALVVLALGAIWLSTKR